MKISVSDHVKNLGVIMDSSLVLDKQVSSVVRAAFYQLRIIYKLFFLLGIWRLLFMPLCHHASITVILYI